MKGARGAAAAAPHATPLTLVEAAVGGDDLVAVVRAAAEALGCGVAIVLPAFGPPVQWPERAATAETIRQLLGYASALTAGEPRIAPAGLLASVPVRLGNEVLGAVVALDGAGGDPHPSADPRPWLDAAAAAAAVTALMRDSGGFDPRSARRAFIQMLGLPSQSDPGALIAQGRRLGYDFSAGAIAVAALHQPSAAEWDVLDRCGLFAELPGGRLAGLVALAGEGGDELVSEVLASIEQHGHAAVASSPRRDPDLLADILREACLLLELRLDPRALLSSQEDTYRLLVGVLLRDPDELSELRERTVAELTRYDRLHDTELLQTLEAFLAHHGSTTETAEAMGLHRHTVGYRLARVQEVAGLSPYESDGRERLGLGLKADRILAAEARLAAATAA